MGLRELGSIDIVLERPPFETESCRLLLLIIDATSDLTDSERLNFLIKKLTSYVAYVAGPQFQDDHPGLSASDVIVRVLTVMPPTIDMQMVNAIKTRGGETKLRVFFNDYHEYMKLVRSLKKRPPSMN